MRLRTYDQILQLLANHDESEVQLAAEVVRKTSVVVMDTEVGGADFAHTQFLLLIAGCGHRVAIVDLHNSNAGFTQTDRISYI